MIERMDQIDDLERLEIELLLEALYRHYGVDFRKYAFPVIRRRIWHRIRSERLMSVSGLQEQVLHDPAVFKRLTSDFSINVTEMFRDPSFFRAFRSKVVPLLRGYPSIRIWHAGCSTGEEAYSMAILLHEEGLLERSRIYATDMNEEVIERAKLESFDTEHMHKYSSNYLLGGGRKSMSDYLTVTNNRVKYQPFLASRITFAQHNLAVDESFNEFHVIICRNVLIYFNAELQHRAHTLFYQSLSPSGFLGLGHKESITFTRFTDCYKEIEHNEKLYRKVK
ncbi:chemotaxis protein methyltransferase CheR [Paenibacillus cellulosilyticus]|uniref:Chemotaxis protein methyltransferase CheR n=1 Tax=Paenibacillus cellulosilyticus TaxID=375489 RepID=A0A2V2YVB4_9BACL|nr:protein-glutamate O-methyltransferase CheR [Paenibacillus cellulosilyticus]PWW05167.1 chemotaxis protein methyltransferase CheR [Paenibacillus cellulosilyticus]